jgi:hypothetical protein
LDAYLSSTQSPHQAQRCLCSEMSNRSDRRTTDDVRTALQSVDWNFSGSSTWRTSIHLIHWYPGNFIPQIPSFLLQILTAPNSIVLDPFCGSGTTGLEAARLGRRSIQFDLNPVATAVATAKLHAGTWAGLGDALRTFSQQLTWDHLMQTPDVGPDGCGADPELRSWLHPRAHAELLFLWQLISVTQDSRLRGILEVIFFDTLFACASTRGSRTSSGGLRRHHWGWIADNVRPGAPKQLKTHDLFRDRLHRTLVACSAESVSTSADWIVGNADARSLPVRDSAIDAIVTSPPYVGMIDYTLANRLTYLWMNWPMKEHKLREIGARWRRTRPSSVLRYQTEMRSAIAELARVLRSGGYLAVVLGASRGAEVVTKDLFATITDTLMPVWGPIPRIPDRRRIGEKQGRSPTEAICVYQKP